MQNPKVITPEAARAAGISPASLRQVAAWNAEMADEVRRRDPTTSTRCALQAADLRKVAAKVERLEKADAA